LRSAIRHLEDEALSIEEPVPSSESMTVAAEDPAATFARLLDRSLDRWTGALQPGPDGVAPWRPVTLWPGESAVLSVLATAGSCAASPGDTTISGAMGIESIPLVVDVAGYGYVESVPITTVEIAGTEPCSSS
jgi:hypothetical protein